MDVASVFAALIDCKADRQSLEAFSERVGEPIGATETLGAWMDRVAQPHREHERRERIRSLAMTIAVNTREEAVYRKAFASLARELGYELVDSRQQRTA